MVNDIKIVVNEYVYTILIFKTFKVCLNHKLSAFFFNLSLKKMYKLYFTINTYKYECCKNFIHKGIFSINESQSK